MSEPNPESRIERSVRQRVLASYRRTFPEPPERIVIGFSGGNDSTALALILIGLGPLIDSDVELLHVDHRMRPASGDDAAAALQLANDLGSSASIVTAVELPETTYPGVGPEEAARRVRFVSLATFAGSGGVVALAHHAGDQSETVLLHLLRGSGAEGIGGIAELETMRVPWWDSSADVSTLQVWRPLLRESKDDLAAIVAARELLPIEDETNLDQAFKRNLIRHRLLPVLREIEPSVDERLGTLAEISRDENAWIESITASMLAPFEGEPGLRVDLVSQSPTGLSRRIVRHWCLSRFNHELTFERGEAIRELCGNPNGAARIEIGDNLFAWRDRTFLHFGSDARAESGPQGAN